MRASIALACTSLAVAAAAACAASGESTAGRPAAPPPNETTLPDASVIDAAVEADAVPGLPTCSSDGWCITKLPDMDLVMRDVWPFPNGAFAIAESPTLGIKVLEWSAAADGEWKYIDDDTQNAIGAGEYAGRLWSPVADEVYFGVAPAFIYHGTRTPTGWTWTRHELPDNSHPGDPAHRVSGHDHGHPESRGLGERYPALGVWGTGKDDVYAWYSNTIFHWQSDDGGAPGWVPEYIADDYDTPDEELFFVAGTGTDRNDVWFSGGRGAQPFSCAIAVRRTAIGGSSMPLLWVGAAASAPAPCS